MSTWWKPKLFTDCVDEIKKEYPEYEDWETDDLNEEFNESRKYNILWDHVGDAYEDYEKLADEYLKLVKSLPKQEVKE